MDIIFDTKGCIGRRNFKPETSTKLFRIVWCWYENFHRIICNDKNINITNVHIQKEDNDPFDERVNITIHGTAYGVDLDEKISFFLSEIFSRKEKIDFNKNLTERFTEKLVRIKFSVDKQHSTLEETMAGLNSK